MANDLQMALELLERDKGIPKEYVLDALNTALLHAYKKNYHDEGENVEVVIDDKGVVKVVAKKLVVEDADFAPEEDNTHITLADAKKIKRTAKVGQEISVPIAPKNFGRIAAQTGKQIIMQKLREAEREQLMEEYAVKSSQLLSGTVLRSERADYRRRDDQTAPVNTAPSFNVIFDIGKTEAIMPVKEQVPGERYDFKDRFELLVLDVKNTPRGVNIVVSRQGTTLVKKLFEKEVPEIQSGLVEIKLASREAGVRSKIAVWSSDEQVDPVGSCVGNRGIRVNNIVSELKGEKIDIVKYSDDPAQLLAAAIAPAKVNEVIISDKYYTDEVREAVVIVDENQLSLAIGKEGLNAKLAARMTGWKIDIKSRSAYEAAKKAAAEQALEDIEM